MMDIPAGSIFRPTSNLFTADFNSPALGQYDFGVPGNDDTSILPISPGSLYVIRTVNFGANIPDGEYLANLDTVPKFNLTLLKAGKAVFGGPLVFVNYYTNNEVMAYFWSNIQADALRGTFSGVLNQGAGLAGVAQIIAHVAMNIFEITDQEFRDKFFGVYGQAVAGVVPGVPRELERRI